ncbi:TPA: hypothetical protein ACWKP8_005632, partial [Escherichia coli]
DKLESKKVDEVVRNLVSSGWNIREVAWEASSFDHEMPYFDTGRDFDIGFPDTLSSKIEFLHIPPQMITHSTLHVTTHSTLV